MRDKRLQQCRRTEVVRADIAVDLVHALTYADLGREMNHRVDTVFQRLAHQIEILDVADNQLRLSQDRMKLLSGMYLLHQIIEHANLISGREQGRTKMASDETGPAGDQNPFRHAISLHSAC